MQHGRHRRSPKSGSYISRSGPVSAVLSNIWLLIVIMRNVYGGCLFCCHILWYCHCYYLCCHLFVIELWFDVFQNYCNLPSNLPQCAGNKKFAFVFPPERVEKKVFRAAGQKQLANMDQLEQRVEKQEWEDFFIIIRGLSFSLLRTLWLTCGVSDVFVTSWYHNIGPRTFQIQNLSSTAFLG